MFVVCVVQSINGERVSAELVQKARFRKLHGIKGAKHMVLGEKLLVSCGTYPYCDSSCSSETWAILLVCCSCLRCDHLASM